MNAFAIRRLNSGGVITNYSCVSSCGHCLYNCSPRREKTYLDQDSARDIFQRIIHLGCRSVHIGGGEPLLEPEKLHAVLNSARKEGMGIDYIALRRVFYPKFNRLKDRFHGHVI